MKPGWLEEQLKKASNEVQNWPDWMKRAAGKIQDDLKDVQSPPTDEKVASTERTKAKKASG